MLKTLEIALAVVLFALGVRSLVYWTRRGVDGTRTVHFVWFALFVLGRVGCWWSLAGILVLGATIPYEGRALVDEWSNYRWFLIVPLSAGALQMIAAWFLGHSSDEPTEPQGSDDASA